MSPSADEVWAAVKAEMEAMHVPFDAGLAALTTRTEQLMRISAVTAWRLAQTEIAHDLEALARG